MGVKASSAIKTGILFLAGAAAGFGGGFLVKNANLKELVPLIATLVGGALAVVGGFAANYLLSKIAHDRARREFLTAKLEGILLKSVDAVNLIQEMLDKKMRKALAGQADEESAPYYVNLDLAQIRLVTGSYCPELQARRFRRPLRIRQSARWRQRRTRRRLRREWKCSATSSSVMPARARAASSSSARRTRSLASGMLT